MDQIKSTLEFDYYLAVHKAGGQFIKLDFGLVSPDSIETISVGKPIIIRPYNMVEGQPQIVWRKIDRTASKNLITIGSFFTSN